MLESLSIVNYALIDKLEVNFLTGFSVITGETGAGKSIILGALSLILGGRADLGVLRDKNRKCVIEGVFRNDKLDLSDFFIQNDLDIDKQTIIRRELLPSGKSRAFINDTPVNLKTIAFLGNKFVNIHSQNQTLRLSDSSFQLNVLDDFIDKPDYLLNYQEFYRSHNSLVNRLNELTVLNEKAIKDEDYFRFQFDELNNATLDVETFEDLENRARILEHAEEIKQALSEAESILTGEETAVLSNISSVIKSVGRIKSYLPIATDLEERLSSLLIELEDISSEIESANSTDDFDAVEFQIINDRLDLVYSLFKKHNVLSVIELIDVRNDYDMKLNEISSLESEIDVVKKELNILEKDLKEKAGLLHDVRKRGGSRFADSIMKVLYSLGMKDAGFRVEIDKLPGFGSYGFDKVKFMFNANLGIPQGEISKIASGGELSRLMLAIKSLINHQQMMPTVIFDEIDSGVSGDIAGKVGSILKKMSNSHQVISITHLPQIASKADHHYKVYKVTSNKNTTTSLNLLSKDGRVEEIATMLSSKKVTETALGVARELMNDS